MAKYVTVEECNQKPHISRALIITISGLFVALFSLFVMLMAYSATEACAAADKVEQVSVKTDQAITQLKEAAISNKAAIVMQKDRYDTFVSKLDEICQELKEQRVEQRKLFEKVIELQAKQHD